MGSNPTSSAKASFQNLSEQPKSGRKLLFLGLLVNPHCLTLSLCSAHELGAFWGHQKWELGASVLWRLPGADRLGMPPCQGGGKAVQAARRSWPLSGSAAKRFEILAVEIPNWGEGKEADIRALSGRHSRAGAREARDRRPRAARWSRSSFGKAAAQGCGDSAGGRILPDHRGRVDGKSGTRLVATSCRLGEEQLGEGCFPLPWAAPNRFDHDADDIGSPTTDRGARRDRDGASDATTPVRDLRARDHPRRPDPAVHEN